MAVTSDRAPAALRPTGDERQHERHGDEAISVDFTPTGFYARTGKQWFDRAAAAILLVVSAPLMAAAAALVRLGLGRPVIFRQRRVGQDGRDLELLKFRTMHPDRREADVGPPAGCLDRRRIHKTDHDPRHTRVGKLLRKSALDELPQLVHVMKGDMSLVGPRPELREVFDDRYEPWQRHRTVVKPGLTGLWQVTARERGNPIYHDVDVDLAYIENVSLALDLRILAATPLVMAGVDVADFVNPRPGRDS